MLGKNRRLLPSEKTFAGEIFLRGDLSGWKGLWTTKLIRSGCGKDVVFTCSMGRRSRCPTTPQNQEAYPQVDTQKPGLGFPIARIGAITSLSCGAILDLGFCRYAGKGQGEVSLLRQMWGFFRPDDVLLTDRLLSSWTELVRAERARH